MTAPERHLASHVFNVVVLVVGTAALAFMMHRLGLANLEEVLADAGGWLAATIALDLAALAIVIHRGAAGTATAAARGLRFVSPERAARWRGRLADIDRHLRELHVDRSPGTHVGFALLGASRLVQWSATTLVLHAI